MYQDYKKKDGFSIKNRLRSLGVAIGIVLSIRLPHNVFVIGVA
jgi:hypothetical protein